MQHLQLLVNILFVESETQQLRIPEVILGSLSVMAVTSTFLALTILVAAVMSS